MRWTFLLWLLTRALILTCAAAAAFHAPSYGLGNWDGAWYGSIVVHGYEFAHDGKAHNVAFFPLFPLIASVPVRFGVPWPLAGIIVNNIAFLGALLASYAYARRRFGETTARWCVIVLVLSPLSLFGSTAYSEGLFLLFAALALWAFDCDAYLAAGVAAAAASATRPLGIALALALLVAVVVKRRGPRAFAQTSFGLLGIVGFAAFCAMRFGDAGAFIHAQTAWRNAGGVNLPAWLGLLHGAAGGRVHDWIALVMTVAAVAAFTICRRAIGIAGAAYACIALALFAFAGSPLSLDRNLFTVLPVAVVFALVFRRVPYIGYAFAIAALVVLAADTMAFARFQWVA